MRLASVICVSCLLLPKETALNSEEAASAPPPDLSIGVDRDALDVLRRLLRFRQRDGQNTVAKRRLGLVFPDALQRNLALERSVIALAEELAFIIALGLLLAADRQHAA